MSIIQNSGDETETPATISTFLERVRSFYESADANALRQYVYWPDGAAAQRNSLEWALTLLREAVVPPPDNYLPIMPVDELSIACVERVNGPVSQIAVRRWHLGRIEERFQDALLDSDLSTYVRSVRRELEERSSALQAMDRDAKRYKADYVSKGVRPRGSVLRPVQLACQNVVIGLATMRHDQTFDGLRVPIYVTCEVPHVATHEANRAMAALILCDAFQNGGTMEVRFGDRKRPLKIPPGLARFARTVDVSIGEDDPACITPAEARSLFTAVTPIPDDLRLRLDDLIDRRLLSPERACYVLMAGLWTAIEFDYIAATSVRAETIMKGGLSHEMRSARQSELETCRAAAMLGMLLKHLTNADSSAGNGVRIVEDSAIDVAWSINEESGAVVFAADRMFGLPWRAADVDGAVRSADTLIVVPRGLPTSIDFDTVRDLQATHANSVVSLLIPADMAGVVPNGISRMVCPERLAELDAGIERRATALRVGRA